MPFDNAGKHLMLDHLGTLIDEVALHSADPGAGAANEISGGGYTRLAPAWSAAAAGEKALSADLAFSGPGSQGVTWFTLWDGATRIGKGQITSGDTAFNAAGEFNLTTGTKLRLTDPA